MSALGKELTPYGSQLTAGPLGVVQVGFAGYDLGKTVGEASLSQDADMKDILYQQTGTKADDHVLTGVDYMVTAHFGEISTELLKVVCPYLFASQGSVGADGGVFKADLYTSLKDTIANVLRLVSVINQSPSEDIEDRMEFYTAIPLIDASMIVWEADTQRDLVINFMIKARQVAAGESTIFANKSIYGYFGDPTTQDVPDAEYPDINGPYPVSAEVTLATELQITLSENATAVSGPTQIEKFIAKIDDVFKAPTSVAYASNVITLTFASATFASGDEVVVSGGAGAFEDGETTPNENTAFSDFPVTNSL